MFLMSSQAWQEVDVDTCSISIIGSLIFKRNVSAFSLNTIVDVLLWKWHHQLLPFGSKSHKRVHFRSCSVAISRQRFNRFWKSLVLETVIPGLNFLLYNLLDNFAPWPRKWGSRGPIAVYAIRKWLILILWETIRLAASKFNKAYRPTVSTFTLEMTPPTSSNP